MQWTQLNNKYSILYTPSSTVILEKLTTSQLVRKFPTFYGTRRFITTFTSARHLSLSWATSILPCLPFQFLKFHHNSILPSIPGVFQDISYCTKNMYACRLSPIHATCPAHLILLNFITWTILGVEYRSLSYSCSFLHSPVTLSLLGPNILLSTLFSNTPPPTFLPQCQRTNYKP